MITTSAEYKTAINAPSRRIVPKAVIDLTDPDLQVTSTGGDYDASYSFPAQLTDRDTTYSGLIYATLEQNRWLLDGSQNIMPNSPLTRTGEQGVIGDTLCGADATGAETLIVNISGVDTLQMVTMASTGLVCDGYPVNVTLNIYASGSLIYSTTEDCSVIHEFTGFTAIQPTEIEIIVNEWSLPYRRYRFVELHPGLIETWGGDTIFRMDVIQKADFSNLTCPYASATLELDNTTKRFDPSNKDGLFLSVVARQPVPLWYGVEIADSFEYVPLGVFYQKNEGWSIQNDGLTIRWDLIDIIGLLSERKYEAPSTLPTTLTNWIKSIVNQLGSSFTGHYTIDSGGSTSLTCQASDLTDITCGDLLRFVCQAANKYAVSDPTTGYLHIKSLDNTAQSVIDLRTQNSRPGSQSNTDIAFLTFDIAGVQYSIPGTEEISDKTVNIKNPFITTTAKATSAAQVILTQYGGNILDVKCRGDMSREIGDVETVEVYPNTTTAARIYEQQLTLDNGIMTNVPLKLLQANGGQLYTDYILITQSGTYTMPAGVTEITLVLIGGGDGGQGGEGGMQNLMGTDGSGGAGGKGGKVYSTPLTINDGQSIDFVIGQGGEGGEGSRVSGGMTSDPPPIPGSLGTAGEPTTATLSTTFSSANGNYMPTGYVDLLTNRVFAVPGSKGKDNQKDPKQGANGTAKRGNGGNGGDGGNGAVFGYDEDLFGQPAPDGGIYSGWYIKTPPTAGEKGGNGGSGCAIVFYAR